ncbi:aminotransferase class IV [Streptomyces qinzhouensis]|uniref:Aminotransferase n=1 Tax=Streptomyces qinzhouensis TaxID=2599401 RepID=A0A5B8IHU1_9ACTN|nr:aminotransferase class IV [Streptomyces qinzhouensis]QDY78228.1 aminotransferase [Streptomyces qinzhouensis]
MANLDDRSATAGELLPLALTSYGHFTTLRVEADGRVRGLSLHLERLVRDARTLFGTGVETGRVRGLIRAATEGRELPCTVRVTHYDPELNLARPVDAGEPRFLATVRPAGELSPPPLAVLSVAYERDLPLVKHCGLVGALHARRTAQLAGFDDALFVGRDGLVSEGVTWNVGFVDAEGRIVRPEGPALPGVTEALLPRGTSAPVTLESAKRMRAAFATNTAIGVRALSSVDGTPMDTAHPVLGELREAYLAVPGEEV